LPAAEGVHTITVAHAGYEPGHAPAGMTPLDASAPLAEGVRMGGAAAGALRRAQ
jgi:hypothetical protein